MHITPYFIMNTEDDTFKKLKRISFEEMQRIRHHIIMEFTSSNGQGSKTCNDIVDYEKYGWTYTEYLKEFNEKFPSENRR